MKQITLDEVFLKPKLFISALLVLSFSLFSMAATAALPSAVDKAQTERSTRDFNHMTTGFPLTGLHTTVECGSCHVGGIFKGTPRNCAGCHSKGMRVVATAKSLKHLVTTEPCEVCHTNTVTFFGARFNHGKAIVGQCKTCHNGLVATGKAASHNTGKKATESCDSCHRTFAWSPASWNHRSAALCSSCHNWTTGVDTPIKSNHTATALACNDCHLQTGWLPAAYRHSGNTVGVCGTCHNGSSAVGKAASHIPTTGNNCDLCHTSTTSFAIYTMSHSGLTACTSCHATGTSYSVLTKRTIGNHQGSTAGQDCDDCHTTTSSWSGALGAMPSTHIVYNAGASCSSCHVGGSVISGASLHTYVSTYACTACHLTGVVKSLGVSGKKSVGHEGMQSGDDCSKSGCHKPLGSKGTAYINWD